MGILHPFRALRSALRRRRFRALVRAVSRDAVVAQYLNGWTGHAAVALQGDPTLVAWRAGSGAAWRFGETGDFSAVLEDHVWNALFLSPLDGTGGGYRASPRLLSRDGSVPSRMGGASGRDAAFIPFRARPAREWSGGTRRRPF